MSDKVRIAIIGVNNMGSGHIRRIQKVSSLELVAICDLDSTKKKLAEENKCLFFEDYQKLLDDRICDAILISTPHYSHTTIGVQALQAGYHVLVEKPISVHKADCERLISAYRDKTKVFAAMFQQRTCFSYKKAKELIDRGDLGEIQRVNWIVTTWYRTQKYYDSGSWRATWKGEGGGVLLNQCPHNLDILQWLCGMPKKVTAIGEVGKYHNIEVEDDITAIFEFPNGATGVFVTTTGEAPGTNRFEIVGTSGKIVIEDNQKFTFIRNQTPTDIHIKEAQNFSEKPEQWDIKIPIQQGGGLHTNILENFSKTIQGQEDLIAPAIEGIHSVELANAIIYSALNGKSVKLPLDAFLFEEFLEKKIAESESNHKE